MLTTEDLRDIEEQKNILLTIMAIRNNPSALDQFIEGMDNISHPEHLCIFCRKDYLDLESLFYCLENLMEITNPIPLQQLTGISIGIQKDAEDFSTGLLRCQLSFDRREISGLDLPSIIHDLKDTFSLACICTQDIQYKKAITLIAFSDVPCLHVPIMPFYKLKFLLQEIMKIQCTGHVGIVGMKV
jgi:hypothetical protein